MAKVLRLADFDQAQTVDLLNGNIYLANDGWRPARATPDPVGYYPDVLETLRLLSRSDVATTLTAEDAIDDMRELIDLWRENPFRPDSGWLEYNTDGENPKRALIKFLSFYPAQQQGIGPINTTPQAWDMIVERHPFWETPTRTQVLTDVLNDLWDAAPFTFSNIAGTKPARIARTKITRNTGTDSIAKIWLGIREELEGTTDFDPLFEFESGNSLTDTALASDAGGTATDASPQGSTANNILRTTFVTNTLQQRCYFTIVDHTGTLIDFSHYVGEYTVLVRCKVSSGTTCGIQLRWTIGDSRVRNQEVYNVDNTTYKLINVGNINIPGFGNRAEYNALSSGNVRNFEFRMAAEVITSNGGTDTLDWDALYLIPARHQIHVETLDINDVPDFFILTHEDDSIDAFELFKDWTPIRRIVPAAYRDWSLPVGNSIMVAAAERDGVHSLSEDLEFNMHIYNRWINHRTA